jgi:hypothetical protein
MRKAALSFLVLAACRGPGSGPPPSSSTAPSPVVAAAFSASASPVTSAAPALPPLPTSCAPAGEGVGFFVTPRVPRPGVPVRVLVHAEAPLDASLSLVDAAGAELAGSAERYGGPPYFWYAELPAPAAGMYRAVLRGREGASCQALTVAAEKAAAVPRSTGAWPVRAAWDRGVERLYSAWIERLFDAPVGAELAFPALHQALRDPARNLLHDHLGLGEDDDGPRAPVIEPDCADLPYFLRAYFAHKLGLPFGFSSCTRGGAGQPPACRSWHSNLEAQPQRSSETATFVDFLRVKLADTVHSGTGRTPADQDAGDYYPVRLSFESLRPGTVYADPYGHVLIIAKRVAQTETAGGILYAVDGQPDGTVSRRRFWRGNFLFDLDPALGSPGWKRFRPVVLDAAGRPHALGNAAIAADAAYGDLSLMQYERGVEGFYDAMEDVLSPAPLDPARALDEVLAALEEQVRGRVLSVANARKHFAGGGTSIDMPEGPAIFEAVGPWEDFSTPSRDLRLLIAVDVVRGFPDRVARRPQRYAMPAGQPAAAVTRALGQQLEAELARRKFAYERSDGSSFTLSLADVVARAAELEMAYNPNDCPELRWGAPAGSDEIGPCRRHAPGSQTARMRKVRSWFHERRRPPRG